MVPMRYIFRSKWWALLWAAGICLSAVEFAGGQSKGADATGNDVNLATLDMPG
jgi:hypothetical protein